MAPPTYIQNLYPLFVAPPAQPYRIDYQENNAHLTYLSGSRANLFRELVNRGILDVYGNITYNYFYHRLPSLNKEELKMIETELYRKFVLTVDNEEIEISIGGLVRSFIKNSKRQYQIKTTHLIGSYVTYLLFNQTDYAQRVFEALDIESLYNEYWSLVKKARVPPSDIDFRMHMLKKGCSYPLSFDDLQKMRKTVIDQLVYWYRVGNIEMQDKQILDQGFESLCTIATQTNVFQIISFENSPIDWILFGELNRACVFTLDDLYLPVKSLFDKSMENFSKPQSFRGLPLESFFHHILGFIKADFPYSIDERGWFRYLSCVVKGNYSIQNQEPITLEEMLYRKLYDQWMRYDQTRVGILNEEIKKWLTKHHANDPLSQCFFIFNTLLFLQERLKEHDLKNVLIYQLSSISVKDPFIASLLDLILKQKMPIGRVADFLQLCSLLIHLRQCQTHEDIQIEIGTESFSKPLILFRFKGRTLQIEIVPEKALARLSSFQEQEPKLWKGLEKNLISLLFILYPPSEPLKAGDEKIVNSLGIDLKKLEDPLFLLMKSSSTSLKYLGLLIHSLLPTIAENKVQAVAEEHAIDILSLTESSEKKEQIKQQLEHFVGKGSIPALDDSNFEQTWMKTLFATERGSHETAYLLWKKMVDREEGLDFSLSLMGTLSYKRADLALRVFLYLDKTTKLKKKDYEALVRQYLEIPQEINSIAFQTLICELFKKIIDFSEERKWAELLSNFVKSFCKNLKNIDENLWFTYFENLYNHSQDLIYQNYELLDSHQLLDVEKNRHIYQFIYCKTVNVLCDKKDKKILKLLKNQIKYTKIFQEYYIPELAAIAHGYLIKGSTPFVLKDPSLIPYIKQVYQDLQLIYEDYLKPEYQPVSGSSKSEFYLAIANIDLLYLEILLKSKNKQNIIDVQSILSTNLKKTLPSQYWRVCASGLINLLTVEMDPLLLEELDQILEFLEILAVPHIKHQQVISFLIKHKTPLRCLRALQMWSQCVEGNQFKHNLETWKKGYSLFKEVVQAQKDEFFQPLGAIILQLTKHVVPFSNVIGKTFNIQLLEIQLLHFRQATDPSYAPMLYQYLKAVFVMLPNVEDSFDRSNLLLAVPKAILTMGRFDSFKDQFEKTMLEFWSLIDNLKKKKSKKNDSVNQRMAPSEIKLFVIQETLNTATDHPIAETLLKIALRFLQEVKQDQKKFPDKERVLQLSDLYKKQLTTFVQKKNGNSAPPP